jgi:hypothetical protein
VKPNASAETHAQRAARIDTRELTQRLRRMQIEQRETRAAIESGLRRQHWGRLPEGWHEGPEDGRPDERRPDHLRSSHQQPADESEQDRAASRARGGSWRWRERPEAHG